MRESKAQQVLGKEDRQKGLTISCRDDPEVQRRLRIMQIDNPGVQRRKIAQVIQDEVLPFVDKLFNERKLPAGLLELESEYKRKVLYPRSVYKYQKLYEGCHKYDMVPDRPYTSNYLDILAPYSHPWRSSNTFTFDQNNDRNKRALDKGAGLPHFKSKGEQLPHALQYVNNIIKPKPSLSVMYSVFPNSRTQQSPPDDPKVRLVWMYPITTWILECEALDDALNKTIAANQSHNSAIRLFYFDPMSSLPGWYSQWDKEVVCWVNLDSSSFDTTVRASELVAGWQYFAGGYEYVKLLARYSIYSSLVMPEEDLVRSGGMPSGSKFTNLGDGFTNVQDMLEVLNKIELLDKLVCILVNGDDITLGFKVMVTEDIIAKISHHSRRTINVEKTKVRTWVWNSKWYVDENIVTRPIYRCLNSIMFSEHRMNPVTGSKEFVEIQLAMQLHDIENHPLGKEVIDVIKLKTKYHISSMNDAELLEAAKVYLNDHSWMTEQTGMFSTPQEFVRWLRNTYYAQT